MIKPENITAIILAGGRGSRLQGADKGLITFRDKPLITHIIDAIKPQVGKIAINANRNLEQYKSYGHDVFTDSLANFQGPLAGFFSGMQHADTDYILTLPCDGPYIPDDMTRRMSTALQENSAELAVAYDGQRLQPVHALIPVSLQKSLQTFLENGDRKIDLWYKQHKMALADFSDIADVFNNINTADDQNRLQSKQEHPRHD